MVKTLKIVIHLIWMVTIITLGTAIGALFGWENHGWLGAIVSGAIGLGVGAFVASSPCREAEWRAGFAAGLNQHPASRFVDCARRQASSSFGLRLSM
jgi:hypothetical protein